MLFRSSWNDSSSAQSSSQSTRTIQARPLLPAPPEPIYQMRPNQTHRASASITRPRSTYTKLVDLVPVPPPTVPAAVASQYEVPKLSKSVSDVNYSPMEVPNISQPPRRSVYERSAGLGGTVAKRVPGSSASYRKLRPQIPPPNPPSSRNAQSSQSLVDLITPTFQPYHRSNSASKCIPIETSM